MVVVKDVKRRYTVVGEWPTFQVLDVLKGTHSDPFEDEAKAKRLADRQQDAWVAETQYASMCMDEHLNNSFRQVEGWETPMGRWHGRYAAWMRAKPKGQSFYSPSSTGRFALAEDDEISCRIDDPYNGLIYRRPKREHSAPVVKPVADTRTMEEKLADGDVAALAGTPEYREAVELARWAGMDHREAHAIGMKAARNAYVGVA